VIGRLGWCQLRTGASHIGLNPPRTQDDADVVLEFQRQVLVPHVESCFADFISDESTRSEGYAWADGDRTQGRADRDNDWGLVSKAFN